MCKQVRILHTDVYMYVSKCLCEHMYISKFVHVKFKKRNRISSGFHCGLLIIVLKFRGDDIVVCGLYATIVQRKGGRSALECTCTKAGISTVELQRWFSFMQDNCLLCRYMQCFVNLQSFVHNETWKPKYIRKDIIKMYLK